MILPSGAIVAVADGERIRLLCNGGVEPRVELMEIPTLVLAQDHADRGLAITVAPPTRTTSGLRRMTSRPPPLRS
jgi:protein required for attachment to host cells